MHQLHSLRTVIITASDAQYFDLAQGTILSVLEAQKTNQISIGFLDLGCTLEQLAWLKQRVDSIQKPTWHFNFPNQDKTPGYVKGLLVRPYLRQYFPDFDIYLWIDADAWVQDWLAPELYIHGAARRKGLAITPEYHRASQQLYGGLPNFWRWIYDRYLENFNEAIAQKLQSYPLCNAGIFSLHKDAKHWQLWEKHLKEALQKPQEKMVKMSDQFVLNFVIYECGLFNYTEILPAWCNWIFNAFPAWDKIQGRLVEPYLPHHPIGILHLAGRQNIGSVKLQATDGSIVELNVRYKSKQNPVFRDASKVELMNSTSHSQNRWDYISPGFHVVRPDSAFPNMQVGQADPSKWKYLRWQIPHNWYVDQRYPHIGFLSRDEVHILYNNALRFRGKKALEIGCWMGWSACHLMLAGVDLDIIDPILANPEVRTSVVSSLQTACQSAGIAGQFVLVPGYSPQKVEELALQHGRKWSLIFIDGEHGAPGPLNDAIACEKYAEADAMVLFHDLAAPDVAQGLDYFRDRGWHTMIYQTMQIMGVAWRGNVQPVQHQPDPKVSWTLPDFLKGYRTSSLSVPEYPSNHNGDLDSRQEFHEIVEKIRPFSLLSEARLHNLYTKAKEICINDLPGNFVECGTYRGGVAAMLGVIIQRYSSRPRKVYAFDTFEGMPEPTEIDKHQNTPANQTGFGAGALKAPIAENIAKICQILNVQDIVVPVQGLFAQTLPTYKFLIDKISLLHADGDWYESTMDIFRNLYNQVIENGIIQVDDYGHWQGCRQAIHDFEKTQGISFHLYPIDYTGVWFTKQSIR
ncbi:class I SAM-dependent methyltransferase [Trichothermofontia sichuanensis B231]|uniref:class I SAM-dependent methyltransferase n=1 Tax=Trichothermofontia sichuanensis TaxID=3045816 RepID=UPI002245C315|nr:TylF/MycF/NovP-related O-methyltransferase [Trichothermofontia sichuanensis]UZQ55629.1 class I SAM-dependent methyltransferase [Trichothermofontia sichuanensis B231]